MLQHIVNQTAKVHQQCLKQSLTSQYLGNAQSLYI